MKKTWHSLKNRVTAMLLALICVLGLLPTAALAAGADTIKLERFGISGVSYQSASLGRCTMHQMYYGVAGKTSVGFCGTKGGGMGTSLIGQTWGHPKPVTDPTVKMMMAYYYAHSLGIFTDEAHALGVDDIWDSGYSWYMNAWVQAIVWRYKDGSLGDPATACAEGLMYVWNSLKGASYTSIDQTCDGATFRDRANYILDLGKQDVWGDCDVKEYSFTGAGSAAHPASTVQSVMIGSLTVTNEQYKLVVKKVDATNPTKGLAGARFHVESTNGSFSRDIVTGADGTYTFTTGHFSTYAIMSVEDAEKVFEQQDAKAAEQAKEIMLQARSAKTAKGNIKVNLKVNEDAIKAIEDLGYTVKYKFYRSTIKNAKYVGKFETTAKTYTNTTGKKGTRYYYKARVMVYDAQGELVAKTALTQCKYACRIK